MPTTYGRFTVTQTTDENGPYWVLRNQWGEDLWGYETRREAITEAKRLARDEELDEQAMREDR